MQPLIEELGIQSRAKAIRQGIKDLRRLGVRPGGVLLVHSSFRSVRAKAKSIENVIAALALALGEEGTLLLPSLTYEHVNRRSPAFDLAETPSTVGAIPERYRLLSTTRRSMHPTHSVCAYGVKADLIVTGHEDDRTPVGENSPFRKLKNLDGQLLMLGCGLRPNTSMHGIEEISRAPYLFGPKIEYALKNSGELIAERAYTPHGFDGWEQRYDRVEGVLSEPDLMKGRVLGADAWLIEVRDLWEKCAEKIREDPYYFVART